MRSAAFCLRAFPNYPSKHNEIEKFHSIMVLLVFVDDFFCKAEEGFLGEDDVVPPEECTSTRKRLVYIYTFSEVVA